MTTKSDTVFSFRFAVRDGELDFHIGWFWVVLAVGALLWVIL